MEEYSKEAIGRRIANLMIEDGLTYGKLADAIGCTPCTISHWTNGDTTPTTAILYELCRYFDVSADWILGLSNIKKKWKE